MDTNSVISINDYLVTNFDLADCNVSLSNEDEFIYDDENVASTVAGECTITVSKAC
jgi:hypothetical protein